MSTPTQTTSNHVVSPLAIAMEMEQIRSVYGEECLSFVQRECQRAPHKSWDDVLVESLEQWTTTHDRGLTADEVATLSGLSAF